MLTLSTKFYKIKRKQRSVRTCSSFIRWPTDAWFHPVKCKTRAKITYKSAEPIQRRHREIHVAGEIHMRITSQRSALFLARWLSHMRAGARLYVAKFVCFFFSLCSLHFITVCVSKFTYVKYKDVIWVYGAIWLLCESESLSLSLTSGCNYRFRSQTHLQPLETSTFWIHM